VRVRISTYVGPGLVDVTAEGSTETINEVTRFLDNNLSGQGSTITNAVPLQAQYSRFTTVAASTGAVLPRSPGALYEVVVRNNGANALTVYAPAGFQVNGVASASLATSGTFRFVSDSNGNYWAF
jgi:hypothetical protein